MAGDLYLGTAGWSYADWAGLLYPKGLPQSGYLAEYARHFNAVEIDSTFYAIPSRDHVRRWAGETPEGFTFCPKMDKAVTHDKQLVGAQSETAAFLETLGLLGAKLGPVVLQFDYTFTADKIGVLENYLRGLPKEVRFAVEVRNRGWLKDPFYQVLRDANAALVLQDLHYMPRLSLVTTDFTYIRWVGRREDVPGPFSRVVKDRSTELTWWAERISRLLGQGVRVFSFANNHYQGYAPATVALFQERLEQTPGQRAHQGHP